MSSFLLRILSLLLSCQFCLVFAGPVSTSACTGLTQKRGHIALHEHVQFNATVFEAGSLALEGVDGRNAYSLCRVMGTIGYGAKKNNTLRFEVWLPEPSNYNQRYISVGNGGLAGTIDYSTMMTNFNSGFAVGGCDSGHTVSQNGPLKPGGFVDFLNNRDETLAWMHNSIAMFTRPATKLTRAYYHGRPRKLYYQGCSTGGSQGFALAQYHPEIFDGIVAGSPGNYYTHLILSFLWNGLNSNSTESYLSQSALNFTKDAVLKKCDLIDGVSDGLLEDPRKCAFNITSLECATDQNPVVDNSTVCLTSAQIKNAKMFYSGPSNTETGHPVYPGFQVGAEAEWAIQENGLWIQYSIPILQNLVFRNLSYDYAKFNWGTDVDIVDQVAGPLIASTSPDLQAFKKRGGKMVVTQGWADPFNAPTWPVDQRDEMKRIFGTELDEFYSLFMVPGGGHCGGASSYPQMPGTWHSLEALLPWVEQGKAPREMLATNPADGSNSTRKLCPYPKHAVYTKGSINDWGSYICE